MTARRARPRLADFRRGLIGRGKACDKIRFQGLMPANHDHLPPPVACRASRVGARRVVFCVDLGRPAAAPREPGVVVVVAVKGRNIQFDLFVESLFAQDYGNYRVIFAVESERDPAVAAIEACGSGSAKRSRWSSPGCR